MKQICGHFSQTLVVTVAEIRAGISVTMHVKQSRYHSCTLEINGILRTVFDKTVPNRPSFTSEEP